MIDSTGAFEHLYRMSDRFGVFEHADHAEPRRHLGYCTDDMARLLIVAVREPRPRASVVDALEALALRFVCDAQRSHGDTRNRRSRWGRWEARGSLDDCWGRSLWALGVAAGRSDDAPTRELALACFERGARRRSPSRRTMAFAALGASELLRACPGHIGAQGLLEDAATTIPRREPGSPWEWPERRLSYANALLPDALIAAGHTLGDEDLEQHGLDLLKWLVEHETLHGRLSVTPVGGRGPEDPAPRFDQQPIEIAAIADAAARASAVTGDARWADVVHRAAQWFLGANDAGVPMRDAVTGGGYDGLRHDGPNLNQGAESTLALVSTIQQSRALEPVPS